jgi:uncharacterized protein
MTQYPSSDRETVPESPVHQETSTGAPPPLKPSRYNITSDLGDGAKLAFNASSAALVEIDPATCLVVARILGDPNGALSSDEEAVRRDLIEGRYLVPAAEDEVGRLKEKSRLHRSGNPVFMPTIAPTLACNFDCDYCFQRHDSGRMTRETEDALIAFSKEKIEKSESVLVTWFGGEPTLCISTVERLQGALSDLSSRVGATMEPASIVTNGYLLDGRMASRLLASGITSAQVTLDGPERLHDRRRKLRGGQGTFRTILRNLGESSEILGITIRVNVDKQNMEAAPEVVEALDRSGLLPRVQIHFAPVNETDTVCADVRGRCFTSEEFARFRLRIYEELVGGGFRQIDYPDLASAGICGADTENGCVVGPNGLLFKCWEELSLGGERSVGTIFSEDREPYQQANLERYRSWDPFEKVGCVECNILPLCMGGCPLQGLRQNGGDRGWCSPWKHNLVEMLRLRHVCEVGKEVRA